ncbi:hypothetical protein ABTX60_07585 [Streptomyces sp. NPDC126510]|uniref:hypothetical protein n=1 Tax=Streptomyces sp. NPDC126510 TaxID=3155317 RepID=UPI0033200212
MYGHRRRRRAARWSGHGEHLSLLAERIVLGLTAAVGIAVTLADQLDLLDEP